MENTVVKKHYSFEEYWQMELQSEQRHEFIDGQIIAMLGVTKKHNLICGNVYAFFQYALDEKLYNVFIEAVKLQITSEKDYTYPDICVEARNGDTLTDLVIVNPVLVVEVLSAGTKLYDKVDKFLRYKQIPSLRYYVLIDTDKVFVDVYKKQPDGQLWEDEIFTQLDEIIAFPDLQLEIGLKTIYKRVFG
ncbi:MAG TPA: Uma2 family endonuclease [Chitinophagales bacterium]|nr:Uma2 family endonuclease [Chitinophagales bacterium]